MKQRTHSLSRTVCLRCRLAGQYCFFAFLWPGVKPSLRRSILPYHSYIGLLLVVLPTVTIVLGLLEKITFMQIAAAESETDEVSHGRWLANTAGLLALACMAAVVYVLVGGGRAVRSEEDDGDGEAEGSEKDDADEEEAVEGQRSVFSLPAHETSSLLQGTDEGKVGVAESLRRAEDVAPPASFSTYVDEMLNKHFTRRASREGRPPNMAVRVDEYGSTAQYRREPDRHSSRSTSVALPATEPRRSGGTTSERVETGSTSGNQPEQVSPLSPESMWPRFKGVGATGVILSSP